jgi:hypothetical protein
VKTDEYGTVYETCLQCNDDFDDGAEQGYRYCPPCGCSEHENDEPMADLCYLLAGHIGPCVFTPLEIDISDEEMAYVISSIQQVLREAFDAR